MCDSHNLHNITSFVEQIWLHAIRWKLAITWHDYIVATCVYPMLLLSPIPRVHSNTLTSRVNSWKVTVCVYFLCLVPVLWDLNLRLWLILGHQQQDKWSRLVRGIGYSFTRQRVSRRFLGRVFPSVGLLSQNISPKCYDSTIMYQ